MHGTMHRRKSLSLCDLQNSFSVRTWQMIFSDNLMACFVSLYKARHFLFHKEMPMTFWVIGIFLQANQFHLT